MTYVEPGARMALVTPDRVHLVTVPDKDGAVEVRGLGVLTGDLFASIRPGDRLDLGRKSALLLDLTPDLILEGATRRAQIIGPQDAARIGHALGVRPGGVVVEGGVGSGALTTYLAWLVGPTGRVHSFDERADHIRVARANLEAADLVDRVELIEGDLAQADVRAHAFVADVAAPERMVPAAARCLSGAGVACFYSPLVSQVASTREALAAGPFARIRTIEQFEREWVVHDRGARPSFEGLGHTGFLTFATRIHRQDG